MLRLAFSIIFYFEGILFIFTDWFVGLLCTVAGGGLYASHSEVDIKGHTYMAFNNAYDGGEREKTPWSDARMLLW